MLSDALALQKKSEGNFTTIEICNCLPPPPLQWARDGLLVLD